MLPRPPPLDECILLTNPTRRPASADRTARRQFQATGQPVNRTQASDAMTSQLPRYEAKYVCNAGASNAGQSLCVQISRERSYPCQYVDTTRKAIDCATTFAADFSCCIVEIVQKTEFLLSVIGLLFLSLTVEALQGKMCQKSLLSGGGRSVRAKISGGKGRPWGIFFGLYKTRHILLSDGANCTVLHAVVLTQYRRVTDGQTDGRTVTRNCRGASTALAMRALRRAVITRP